jgi:hypothetical protein
VGGDGNDVALVAAGASSITVRVENEAGLSAQQTFVVTVRPVNDVPTITAIPNQAMAEDGPPLVLPFAVSDVESSAGALTVSSSSTNATLVPPGGVTFGGSGAARTVTITPAAVQSGTATVTITVSDGSDTASTSFTLLVIAKETTPESTVYYLAEGATGAFFDTDLLLANPQTVEAPVTIKFLRETGAPVVKTFTVAPSSRFNVAISGPQSDVRELADEFFGARIDSTQPIVVERSVYSNANGVTWAAGTNATATRLP